MLNAVSNLQHLGVTDIMNYALNCDPQDLAKEFSTLNSGELNSCIVFFSIQYERTALLKDECLKSDRDPQDIEKVVKDLYMTLQKIEDVVTVLKEVQRLRNK